MSPRVTAEASASVTVSPLTDTDNTRAGEPATVTANAPAAGTEAVSSTSSNCSVRSVPSTLVPPAASLGPTVSGTTAVAALVSSSAWRASSRKLTPTFRLLPTSFRVTV